MLKELAEDKELEAHDMEKELKRVMGERDNYKQYFSFHFLFF